MRRLMSAWTCAASLSICSGAAFAHPGHGTTEPQTAVHYIAEPVHGLPLLLLALACGACWYGMRLLRRDR